MENKIENMNLDRAVHQALFRAEATKNIGLFDGRMGMAVLFSKYGFNTNNPLYQEYAEEIINKIMHNLSFKEDIGLATGLAGVGWGILYLVNQGLLNGEFLKYCVKINRCIMYADLRRIEDTTFEYGMAGLTHYFIYGKHTNVKNWFDEDFIFDLNNQFNKLIMDKTLMNEVLVGSYVERIFKMIVESIIK